MLGVRLLVLIPHGGAVLFCRCLGDIDDSGAAEAASTAGRDMATRTVTTSSYNSNNKNKQKYAWQESHSYDCKKTHSTERTLSLF